MLGAVILAAGLSNRMGRPKVLLKWEKKTVIEEEVDKILNNKFSEIIIVVGELKPQIEELFHNKKVNVVFNPDYANGEMTGSLKVGLKSFSPKVDAAMIFLGDQPFIKKKTISKVISAYRRSTENIIMPSFHNRRGHPWVIRRELWNEIMGIDAPNTLRDFIKKNQTQIKYVAIDDMNVIQDMDTPEEYEKMLSQNE